MYRGGWRWRWRRGVAIACDRVCRWPRSRRSSCCRYIKDDKWNAGIVCVWRNRCSVHGHDTYDIANNYTDAWAIRVSHCVYPIAWSTRRSYKRCCYVRGASTACNPAAEAVRFGTESVLATLVGLNVVVWRQLPNCVRRSARSGSDRRLYSSGRHRQQQQQQLQRCCGRIECDGDRVCRAIAARERAVADPRQLQQQQIVDVGRCRPSAQRCHHQ